MCARVVARLLVVCRQAYVDVLWSDHVLLQYAAAPPLSVLLSVATASDRVCGVHRATSTAGVAPLLLQHSSQTPVSQQCSVTTSGALISDVDARW